MILIWNPCWATSSRSSRMGSGPGLVPRRLPPDASDLSGTLSALFEYQTC